MKSFTLGETEVQASFWIFPVESIITPQSDNFTLIKEIYILFAASLVAHGVHDFNEVGIIPAVIDPVWNINASLNEDSILGLLLDALQYHPGQIHDHAVTIAGINVQ